MKSKKSRIVSLFLALIMLAMCLSQVAYADQDEEVLDILEGLSEDMPVDIPDAVKDGLSGMSEDISEIDTAGNLLQAGGDFSLKDGVFFGGFGAGKDLTIKNSQFKDTLCLAGKNIDIKGTKVKGSTFVAGKDISITKSNVGGNIALAAYEIKIGAGTKSSAVFSASNQFTFAGETKALKVGANTVKLSGKIDGDARISADNITIDPDTVVNGTLYISSPNDVEVPEGAQIADYKFKKTEKSDESGSIIKKQEKKEQSAIIKKSKSALYFIVAMLLIALLLYWLMPSTNKKAQELSGTKLGTVIGSGAIYLITFPIAFIFICITIVGLPIASVLLTLYIITMCLSVPITAIGLSTLVFKKLKPLLATVIGVVILEIAIKIPFIGILTKLFTILYALGIILQIVWRGRAKKTPKVQPSVDEIIVTQSTPSEQDINE